MRLPLVLSVPHAGWRVPVEVQDICVLSQKDMLEDGDEGASEIYALEAAVLGYVTTDIARAIVDLNRSEDDRRADGVVKTHTCWNVPVYRTLPSEQVIGRLLGRYYRPYHRRLGELAASGAVLGIDCHTMAATAPPIAPDPGAVRPRVCLSNGEGTCPRSWIETMRESFERQFGGSVTINRPFTGGYITRSHSQELPWIQLELSRAPYASPAEKRAKVLAALADWYRKAPGLSPASSC